MVLLQLALMTRTFTPYCGPLHRGVVDRADGVGRVAAAGRIDELQRHDGHVPIHAGHALAVVAHRADDAGDVGAVAVVVHRVAVVGDEVIAVYVAGKAVAAGVRIGPDIGGQVGIGVIDARIDDGDDDVAAAGAYVPGGRQIDVGCGPLLRILRVVGSDCGSRSDLLEGIELRPEDAAIGLKSGQRLTGGNTAGADEHFTHCAQTFEDLILTALRQQAQPTAAGLPAAAGLNCTMKSVAPLTKTAAEEPAAIDVSLAVIDGAAACSGWPES